MKRTLIIATLAVCMSLATAIPAAAADRYTDVKSGDWFAKSVVTLSADGIISGYPDGSFRPEDIVTYGEFLTMAYKVTGGEEALQAAPEADHWAAKYYEQSIKKEYFTEAQIPSAALDKPIDRSYMALICSGILGSSIEVSGDYYNALEASIGDVNSKTANEYAIIRSYGAGILSGYPDGTFKPRATLTRAEAASVIWKLSDESLRTPPDPDKLKELAGKEEQKADKSNMTQEERIQEILDNGPQTITFDPATDETLDEDGRTVMKEDKAREYMDQILASLKFYGSKGKYYMTVTLPEVPEGYQTLIGVDVAYKAVLQKPIWGAHSIWTTSQGADAEIRKVGTSTIEIKGMTSLSQVYTAGVGISINKIDDTDLGSDEASYQMQRSYRDGIRDSFGINRQGSSTLTDLVIEYKLNRHFTWN